MHERIELVFMEKGRSGGFALAIAVSLVLHALLVVWFVRGYQPHTPAASDVPMARYVELMRQNRDGFTEAPGRAVEKAPLTAPLSDANRKASIPEPTGTMPTTRPGDGTGGTFVPPAGDAGAAATAPQRAARPRAAQAPAPANSAPATDAAATSQQTAAATDGLTYREPAASSSTPAAASSTQAAASAASGVDWRSAIREVGKVASLGGQGLDLGNIGGEKGFAEQGPLSFESQWYDWGDYAQSMVSRIRVNWYAQMPQLIRTGMKGVVTIRFTIQRDGRITEILVLESSGVPPYDFAARKAIELSSPLNALPKDFPNSNERVTAKFYYNTAIPAR